MLNDKNDIVSTINNNEKWALTLLEEIVNIDSGSFYREGVNQVGRVMEAHLSEIGFKVKRVPSTMYGDCIIGHRKGDSAKGILLLGHMDTVFAKGEAKKRPFKVIDGKGYGPGINDMKGGLSILILALRALTENNWQSRPITIILNGNEEAGQSIIPQLVEHRADEFIAAFSVEPARPDGSIVINRKGVITLEFQTNGKAAHTAAEGVQKSSAILEMAFKVLELYNLRIGEQRALVNVGMISGGNASNVIAAECSAKVDIRYGSLREKRLVLREIQRIAEKSMVPGTSCHLKVENVFPPMESDASSIRLYEKVKATARWLGVEIKAATTAASSDSGFVKAAGIPILCGMGAVGGCSHSPEEYILINSVRERSSILALSMYSL